jgi:hypothetical protein
MNVLQDLASIVSMRSLHVTFLSKITAKHFTLFTNGMSRPLFQIVKLKLKVRYDRLSISGFHLEPITLFIFLSDNCAFLHVGRPLWGGDKSVIYLCNFFWTLPEQWLSSPSHAELTTIFYCLIWDSSKLDGQVPVFISPMTWVELMLWPAVSWPIRPGVGHPFRTHDQIPSPPFFCRTIVLLFDLGRPLWRENGSAICSAICQWSASRRKYSNPAAHGAIPHEQSGPGLRTHRKHCLFSSSVVVTIETLAVFMYIYYIDIYFLLAIRITHLLICWLYIYIYMTWSGLSNDKSSLTFFLLGRLTVSLETKKNAHRTHTNIHA